MCDGGMQNQYYCHVQGRSGEACGEAVSPVLNTKQYLEEATCITGGSSRLWETMQQFCLCLRLALLRLVRNSDKTCVMVQTIFLLHGISAHSPCVLLRFTYGHMQSNISV